MGVIDAERLANWLFGVGIQMLRPDAVEAVSVGLVIEQIPIGRPARMIGRGISLGHGDPVLFLLRDLPLKRHDKDLGIASRSARIHCRNSQRLR